MDKKRILHGVIACIILFSGAFIGSWVMIEAFADMTVKTALADIDIEVEPAFDGSMELQVPLVAWGARIETRHLPLSIRGEIQEIDRKRAKEALGPDPKAPTNTLRQVRKDGRDVIEQVIERVVLCTIIGALLGSLLAGSLLSTFHLSRRSMLWALVVGVLFPLLWAPSLWLSVKDLRQSPNPDLTYVGNGNEMAKVLAFSEQLLYVGDDYKDLYTRALSSASNIIRFTNEAGKGKNADSESFLIASDLHDNTLITGAFDSFAGDKTVFMPGDFGQVGAEVEEKLAPDIAALGGRVVAVSGNHDSEGFMQALAAEGVLVLTSNGVLSPDGSLDKNQVVVEIEGLKVAGYSDPLEGTELDHSHPLRVYGKEYDQQAVDFITWFDNLPQRPDVVMLHQHGLAHRLLESLKASGDEKPLLIITGHDHVSHVDQAGPHTLIDGGTLGAGGPFAVGEQPAGFAQVLKAKKALRAVDLVTVDPISGNAASRRIVLSKPEFRTYYADAASGD